MVSASRLVTMTCVCRSTAEGNASHTGIGANNTTARLGGGSYTVSIALDGVRACLLDNLGGSLGSGIGILDVVT